MTGLINIKVVSLEQFMNFNVERGYTACGRAMVAKSDKVAFPRNSVTNTSGKRMYVCMNACMYSSHGFNR